MNNLKQIFSAESRVVVAMNGNGQALNVLTDDEFNKACSGDAGQMLLESCTLEDIENTYLYGLPLHESNMLEAITTTLKRVDMTMRAFNVALSRALSGSSITSEGARTGEPRTAGGFATLVSRFLLSDGQAISIIFHSPSGDPKRIVGDDTLVAFRFLLNKRDVTPTVAPAGGQDISLKQVTLKLANMAEKNSAKFQNSQAKVKAQNDRLEELQSLIETREAEATSEMERAEKLESLKAKDQKVLDAHNSSIYKAERKIEALKSELNSLEEKAKAKVKDISDNEKPDVENNPPADISRAAKAALHDIKREIDTNGATYKKIEDGREGYRGYDKKAFSQSIYGKMKTFAKNHSERAVDLALEHLAYQSNLLGVTMFTDRHGIWKLGTGEVKPPASVKKQAVQTGPTLAQHITRYNMLTSEYHAKDDKLESALLDNSTDRGQLPDTTRIKAMRKAVKSASDKSVKEYNNIVALLKAWQAKGYTAIQWDAAVTKAQGHTDTLSWEEIVHEEDLEFNADEPEPEPEPDPTPEPTPEPEPEPEPTPEPEPEPEPKSKDDELTKYRKMLADLESGAISPSDVVGGGYKDGRAVATGWILKQILMLIMPRYADGSLITEVTTASKGAEFKSEDKAFRSAMGKKVKEYRGLREFVRIDGRGSLVTRMTKNQLDNMNSNVEVNDELEKAQGDYIGAAGINFRTKENMMIGVGEFGATWHEHGLSNPQALLRLIEAEPVSIADRNQLKEVAMQYVIDDKLSTAKEVFGAEGKLHWYGLRARPLGLGAQPSGNVASLSQEEAGFYFPNSKNTGDIRHGAIAYKEPLASELIASYELVDMSNIVSGFTPNLDNAKSILVEAVNLYLKEKSLDGITQDTLDTLKMESLPFAKQIRERDEFTERRENVERYKQWKADVTLITPEFVQEVVEDMGIILTVEQAKTYKDRQKEAENYSTPKDKVIKLFDSFTDQGEIHTFAERNNDGTIVITNANAENAINRRFTLKRDDPMAKKFTFEGFNESDNAEAGLPDYVLDALAGINMKPFIDDNGKMSFDGQDAIYSAFFADPRILEYFGKDVTKMTQFIQTIRNDHNNGSKPFMQTYQGAELEPDQEPEPDVTANDDVALIQDAIDNGTDADQMIELIEQVALRMQENGTYAENEPLLERLSMRITELLEAQ